MSMPLWMAFSLSMGMFVLIMIAYLLVARHSRGDGAKRLAAAARAPFYSAVALALAAWVSLTVAAVYAETWVFWLALTFSFCCVIAMVALIIHYRLRGRHLAIRDALRKMSQTHKE